MQLAVKYLLQRERLHVERAALTDRHREECPTRSKQPVRSSWAAMAMKLRLDQLLVQRGLVPSRERAQAMILAGRVLVNDQKFEKPGTSVSMDVSLRVLGEDLRYVSRGGLKLEQALRHWAIPLKGKTCLDVGASTGGFTDCMLQHGATRVIVVDTGYGQIAAKLRQDPRVVLRENTNARYLTSAQLEGPIDFLAMDVSFISATLVLPAVMASVHEKAAPANHTFELEAVILVKPQFEVGREQVGKRGIVRDEKQQLVAIQRVKTSVEQLGGEKVESIDSPILGAEGNREFLLHSWFRRVIA